MTRYCPYCKGTNHSDTWHDCEPAQRMKIRLEAQVSHIHKMFEKPNYAPQTSDQMRARAETLQGIKVGLKITGGEINECFA